MNVGQKESFNDLNDRLPFTVYYWHEKEGKDLSCIGEALILRGGDDSLIQRKVEIVKEHRDSSSWAVKREATDDKIKTFLWKQQPTIDEQAKYLKEIFNSFESTTFRPQWMYLSRPFKDNPVVFVYGDRI